jgi:hypothetical protein
VTFELDPVSDIDSSYTQTYSAPSQLQTDSNSLEMRPVTVESNVGVRTKRASISLVSGGLAQEPRHQVNETQTELQSTRASLPNHLPISEPPQLPANVPPSELAIPPDLHAFLSSLRVNQESLAPIFIKYGFDTNNALDFLCEIPVSDWKDMKQEIVKQGRLVGWLAVQKGLQQRARAMQAT